MLHAMARLFEIAATLVLGLLVALGKMGMLGDAMALLRPRPDERAMTAASVWSKDYDPKAARAVPYYPNCAAARRAGAAPIHAYQREYRRELDADGDGVACEPYRGR